MAKIENVDIRKSVQDYYMSYAVSTIANRMFPSIDGLKPVQRRIIYEMGKELHLVNGKETKSAKVVGNTMGNFHPHGDSSIYDAMCHMSDFYEAANMPLIHGSSMGKQWSNGEIVPAAAYRYTEAGLTDYANEVYLGGLDKNAVDMVPNYLNDSKEPVLLPVKIPTILINSSKGIACGLCSYPPSYSLQNVCKATIGLLKGELTDDEALAATLGVPDFQTGGTVGISRKQLLSLVKTGETRGIVITSKYVLKKNNVMLITNIPFNTTVETIVAQIRDLVTNNNLQGISRVLNATGDMEMGIEIHLKRGVSHQDIFKILCATTDIQKKISFQLKFVTNEVDEFTGELKHQLVPCSVRELLENHWIPWRVATKRRMYSFDLAKLEKEAMQIGAWLKIKDHTEEYVTIASRNKRKEAFALHQQKFGLTDEEEEYLIGHRAYQFTTDEVEKQLAKYKMNQDAQLRLRNLLADDKLVKADIAAEITNIMNKYATERKSAIEGLNQVIRIDKNKKTVSDKEVYVGVTQNFFLKRAETRGEADSFGTRVSKTDKLTNAFYLRNTDKLLIFTTAGYVYKLPVDAIDNSKAKFRENVWHLVDKDPNDKGEPFMILPAGDYKDQFNIVYLGDKTTGVRKIKTSQFKARNVYKNVFPGYLPEICRITTDDEFLLLTDKGKALYVNLFEMARIETPNKRNMVKMLPNPPKGETIKYLIPMSEITGFKGKEAFFTFGFRQITQADFQLKSHGDENANTVKVQTTEYSEDSGTTEAERLSELIDVDHLFVEDDDYIEDEDLDIYGDDDGYWDGENE